jgi:hypothetical protein
MVLQNHSGGAITPPEQFWRGHNPSRTILEGLEPLEGPEPLQNHSGGARTPPEPFWRGQNPSRFPTPNWKLNSPTAESTFNIPQPNWKDIYISSI